MNTEFFITSCYLNKLSMFKLHLNLKVFKKSEYRTLSSIIIFIFYIKKSIPLSKKKKVAPKKNDNILKLYET